MAAWHYCWMNCKNEKHLRLLEEHSKQSPEIFRFSTTTNCCWAAVKTFTMAEMYGSTMLAWNNARMKAFKVCITEDDLQSAWLKRKCNGEREEETFRQCFESLGYVSVRCYSVPLKYRHILIFLFWLQFSITMVTCFRLKQGHLAHLKSCFLILVTRMLLWGRSTVCCLYRVFIMTLICNYCMALLLKRTYY